MERPFAQFFGVVLSVITFSTSFDAFSQSCDPKHFMVMETEKLTWSEDVQSLFVLNSSKEEFEKAKKNGSLSTPFGTMSHEGAKEVAKRETTSIRSQFSRTQDLDFLRQRLSPTAAEAYARCLAADTRTIGLRLWMEKRQGNYFYINAMWVGGNDKEAIGQASLGPSRGLEILQTPTEFRRGFVETLLLRKEPCSEGFLGLNVGSEKGSIVLLPDGELFATKEEVIFSKRMEVQSTNKTSKDCYPGTMSECVFASKGGYLIPQSGGLYNIVTSEVGTFRQKALDQDLNKMCFEISQSTSACGNKHTAAATVMATLRYAERSGGCTPSK